MANVNAQPYGLTGSGLNFAAADPAGDVAICRPGLFLAVRNAHASAPRVLTLEAVGRCNAGRLHDVEVSVPPTPAGGAPTLVPLGWDGRRFSRVSIAYADASLVSIALAYVEALIGVGSVDVTAPALGGSPGTIERVGQAQADELTFEPAVAGGMRVDNGDGLTGVFVVNDGAADVAVYVRALAACSDGLLDHYSVTVAAGETRQLPRFRTDLYGTTLAITYDDPSGLSFAATRLEVAGG